MPITRSITFAAALALGCSTIAEAPAPTTEDSEPGESTDGSDSTTDTGESSTDSESESESDVDGNSSLDTWPLDVPDGNWEPTEGEADETDTTHESTTGAPY